ncbi:histidine phosphatase family protein [Paenibacillus aceti]|uniref:Phosphoglycerate mutase n=1 Tax=Paenibacillus aceti TaxID=1820010 RepID=A0ABQ1VWV7_9BACL|nr:histidine phosphatase family protein [Paenibacillus aceti]GGG02078.1 phosphoglycerate mutase [Paenibacillus aceti]
MITLGLVRHGVTDWNNQGKAQGISDIPLNQEGRDQAAALAKRLSTEGWDAIISSNLIRAQETAHIISSYSGISLHPTDERLREMNCGLIEGTTEEERVSSWGPQWRKSDLGMESFDQVAERGHEFIQEISLNHRNKRILIVSHGALIGLTLKRLLPNIFTETHISNASLTVIKKTEEQWDCELYNCVEHLSIGRCRS